MKRLQGSRLKELPSTHTLIGDGDDREQILSLIKELGLADCCTLLGTLTHAEVLQHLRDSDIFILGCRIAKNGDRDGIPNVLVESLAMGLPALSTEVSAIPEIIINDKTGLTVPPENSEAMASAILKLLDDSNLRTRVIREGQVLVRQNFDNTTLTAQLAKIFCQTV
jgi:glycosyltransferase involved in cell wall biosynthesis